MPEHQLLRSQIHVLFAPCKELAPNAALQKHFMLIQNRCSKAEQLMDFKENLTYKIRLLQLI